MDIGIAALASLAVAAVAVAAWALGAASARRRTADDGALDAAVADALDVALADLSARAAEERDVTVRRALEHAAVLAREQLGAAATGMATSVSADLTAKKDVIDARLDEMRAEL